MSRFCYRPIRSSLSLSLILDPMISYSIQEFLRDAGNAEQFDGNASVEKALEQLGLTRRTDLLPGMKVELKIHQIIGVAWMLEQERKPIKGGLLADDMGLGKTIQTLTRIVEGRPTKEDRQEGYAKTTLYVKLFKISLLCLSPLNMHS